MNYIIAVFIFLCLIAGCQPSNNVDSTNQPKRSKTPDIFIYDNGLECVQVIYGNRYGLSCNWEKFNKEHEEKKEKNENL